MRIIGSALLFSTALLLGSAAAIALQDIPKYDSSEVLVLGDNNHAEFLNAFTLALIAYFAPWCGHCQRLEPEFKKAAEVLKGTDIKLAHVNCVENEKVCSSQNIRGYPTLKIFSHGKEVEYNGPRDADGIVKYMKKFSGPAVNHIALNELENFKKDEDVVVVGIFPEGSEEAKTFKEVAESLRLEHKFAQLAPGLHMFKKFDEGFSTFKGSALKKDVISKWISTESTPLMAEVTPENYGKYMEAGLPMAYLFYEGQEMRKEYGPIVEEVMRAHKGKINAVYIDAEKFHAHAKALMLPNKWPGFVIHDMDDMKYPFTGKFNKEELAKFTEEYTNGKVEPSYRSEEIPTKDEGPVKTIVYKNFESIVMDEKKDVLIELYAPWCGACKRLAPIYEALAKSYGPHFDKIVIAKMDATANDIPKNAGVKLVKFPTIILFKAGADKKKIELDRPAENVKALVDFISANAENKVEVKIEEPVSEDASKSSPSKDEL